MFIDFYSLLEIPSEASQEEIKSAYRKQCIKWHPDKNPNIDTTQRMQDINQAYLILKDEEARVRYDKEYAKFKSRFENSSGENSTEDSFTSSTSESNSTKNGKYSYPDYKVADDILEKWMENAKKQSRQMAKDAIDEFKGASTEAVSSIGSYFLRVMIPMLVAFLIFKACNS